MENTQEKPSAVLADKNSDLEDVNHEEIKYDGTANLRLNKHGLPLVPQPTIYRDDPLVRLCSSNLYF